MTHQVEVNLLLSGNLNSHVTLDVVNEATHLDVVVIHPSLVSAQFINLNSEEQDLVTTLDNKSLLIDQVHEAQILIVYLLEVKFILALILV